MRLWIIVMTVCSLLSLPFSGSMAADSVHHNGTMDATSDHESKMPMQAVEDAEHCPVNMSSTESFDDCCEDTMNGPECTNCPPDCGHCAMSDHGSTASLSVQQTLAQPAVASPVTRKSSFYQRLSGQPTPPPIIS